MAPYEDAFDRLHTSEGTRRLAQSFYWQATHLTSQSSGCSLGQGHNALPAICAFLASQRLGNGEVTKDQARATACADPKTFDLTLSTVERILSATSLKNLGAPDVTYRSLAKQYVTREDALVPMIEVEAALNRGGEFISEHLDLKSARIQCVIFHWVCTRVLNVSIPDTSHFRQKLGISLKKWSDSQRFVEEHCSHMVDDLAQKAKTAVTASAARATRSQTRAAIKKTVELSLASLTPGSGVGFIPGAPSKSGLVPRTKRNAPSEVGLEERVTPSKRPRKMPNVSSSLGQELATRPPEAKRGSESRFSTPIPKDMENLGLTNESDEPSNEIIVVRSARWSRKQIANRVSNSQHPMTTTAERQPSTSVSFMQASSSVDLAGIDSTPMTSTGVSDMSSPSSPPGPSAQVRPHDSQPSAGKKWSFSLQAKEMSRRQQRNLHAAFLQPGVYGWKPTLHTAQMLERARMFEVLMVSKYGDPWDAY